MVAECAAWGLALWILPRLLRILSGLVWILFSLLPLLGWLPLLLLWIELFWLWWRRCLPLLRGNLALCGEELGDLGILPRLWVLAALGLGLLAVVHDNECTDATDDDDCQDQLEDPLRAGRGGRRGGIRR